MTDDSTVPKSAVKRRPPGGSRKGKPNKVTKALKDMILGALNDAGGQDYLKRQADENPAAFLGLVGKVLPSELKAQITGENGEPIKQTVTIEFVRERPNS
jgi:hypothetical protein